MGGDPQAPEVSTQMAGILNAYAKSLPQLIQSTANGILPMENAQLGAAKAVTPGYTDLLNSVNSSQKLASGQSDLKQLNDSGYGIAGTQMDIDKLINPEFYQARTAGMNGYTDLLSSLNPNNPNPAAERAVNAENVRSGNLNNTNATNTVANAMSFGDKQMARANAFGAALGNMTGFMQASNKNFSPYASTPTSNANNTAGITGVGSNSVGIGQSLLGTTAGVNQGMQSVNANRRDTLDRTNETMSAEPISC